MRVSTKSDYALRGLIELATTTPAGPVSAEELGRRLRGPETMNADLARGGRGSAFSQIKPCFHVAEVVGRYSNLGRTGVNIDHARTEAERHVRSVNRYGISAALMWCSPRV